MILPALPAVPFNASLAVGSQQLVGRELRGYDEFRAAATLYVNVFGYDKDEFTLNPNLLSALAQNGGSAVGVFTEEDELVAFAYGFPGRDADGSEYHYSQAATVDPRYQGKGLGRVLKNLQARSARRLGHLTMRWTFDPLLSRNAHFNFNSLGASGVRYLREYYARPGTDRILVEWAIDERPHERPAAPQPPELGTADWGIAREGASGVWVAIPAALPVDGEFEIRERLGETLTDLLDLGYTLVGCTRIDARTAGYLARIEAP